MEGFVHCVGNPERGWVAEEVGLEHGRWKDNSQNPEVGKLSAWEECSGVRDAIGLSQWEVGVSQWNIGVSQWKIEVSQWEW